MRTLTGLLFCIAVYQVTAWEVDEPTQPKQLDAYTISGDKNYLTDYAPRVAGGLINVVVEIPTGSVDKWEVSKQDGLLRWEMKDGVPRKVAYLGYPGNYGMVPGTLLPKERGGDGDPLDVIVLGPPLVRGSVVKARLVGLLRLTDHGEQDDKLIAVLPGTPFAQARDIDRLTSLYPGVTDIIRTWFVNYKGPGVLEANGFGDLAEAEHVLEISIDAYKAGANR